MAGKKILIVEDERDMAELVAMRLQREHHDVTVAYDGREGLDRVRCDPPDLVLLDIMLPGMSGTDVLRELRSDPRTASVPVIMLTARTEDVDVVVGLQLGADDYVTKPFSMSVLLARIAAVLRRSNGGPVGKGVLTAGPIRIDQERHYVEVDGHAVALTPTEFRLLYHLVENSGWVVPHEALLSKVWGYEYGADEIQNLRLYVSYLRKKIEPDPANPRYIFTEIGTGYRFVDLRQQEPHGAGET